MTTETPWGPAQDVYRIAPGVIWVSTASHGGLLITREEAAKLLTAEARREGSPWRGGFAYEEDSQYSACFYEHPEWCHAIEGRQTRPIDAIKADAWRTLSGWHADYLLARGIAPEPEAYARWLDRQEDQRRRAASDPDLIVSAIGSGCSFDPVPTGAVKVYTADGTAHLVTESSYDARRGVNLLSKCQAFPPTGGENVPGVPGDQLARA